VPLNPCYSTIPFSVICSQEYIYLVHSVQFSRSVVSDSATPWTVARQASLSITNSQSSLKLMSIKSVMPSSHLILCRPLSTRPIYLISAFFSTLYSWFPSSIIHLAFLNLFKNITYPTWDSLFPVWSKNLTGGWKKEDLEWRSSLGQREEAPKCNRWDQSTVDWEADKLGRVC